MRVLRIYHGGRDPGHRERERRLLDAGVEVTLAVPSTWPSAAEQPILPDEGFPIVELAVRRAGDVNRHSYEDDAELHRLVGSLRPDVLDVHEEPVSLAARQWLTAAPPELPVVMYTAQNVDKRFPPPFAQYEQAAYRRVAALYPCTRQAASVVRGKGFAGVVEINPLGIDPAVFQPGSQSLGDEEIVLSLVGRLVSEKGVRDAVRVMARVNRERPARLVLAGSGPEVAPARELAGQLGLGDRLEVQPWLDLHAAANLYRRTHVVLVPSVPTETWTEQFGRVIVEAQASGAVVAGYATGSIAEVGGEPAVLTASTDVAALGGAVLELVSSADEYTRRRAAGLAVVSERTWERVADRQAELYRRVAAGDVERVVLERSPRRRRVAARAEFGATASARAGLRPFALPVLRRGGVLPAALEALVDAGAELRASLRAS